MTPDTPTPDSRERMNMERRKNVALRELIDEMLASIRAATHRELWTPAERQQYERELAEIMVRVRSEAVGRAGSDPRPAA